MQVSLSRTRYALRIIPLGFIIASNHIDLSGNFATQAGWILPPGKDLLLVVEDRRQAEEAALQLHRVGFDRVTGYIEGGMLVWGTAALPISRVPVISPEEAHALTDRTRRSSSMSGHGRSGRMAMQRGRYTFPGMISGHGTPNWILHNSILSCAGEDSGRVLRSAS